MQFVYLSRANPDALYMDSLRLLAQLQQWEAGRLSTLDFWGQASAHRGFVNQAFLFANVHLFNLDVLLANRLTAFVIAALSLGLVSAWCRDARTMAVTEQRSLGALEMTVTLVFAVLFFSWAGYELLTLDLGLPLWTKNLLFVGFFMVHARLVVGDARHPAMAQVSLVLMAPLIVLLVGMGWNYAFCLAVLAVQMIAFVPRWRQTGRWRALAPTLVLLLSMGVYMASGLLVHSDVDAAGMMISADTLVLPFYALGSVFGAPDALLHGGRSQGWLLALGVLNALTGAIALLSWFRRGAPGTPLPLYFLVYGGLVAVSVSVARGADGPGAVVASRYYMDLVLLLIGVIWIAAREALSTGHRKAAIAVLALLFLVCLGHLATYINEWKAGPYRALMFEAMNKAAEQGVPGEDAATLLQSPLPHAREGVAVMREQRLAMFASLPLDYCRTSRITYTSGWNSEESQGRWSRDAAELRVPACECSFVADVYVPPSMARRRVDILGSDGVARSTLIEVGGKTRLDLGPGTNDGVITLRVDPTTIPGRDVPGSQDRRVLGVLVNGISVSCNTGGHE